MEKTFVCDTCGKEKEVPADGIGTGYGVSSDGKKHCYSCCGELDHKEMSEAKKFILYLDMQKKTLGNWCGTFKIQLNHIREGRHNIAGKRYDAWFTFAGKNWHAVQYGNFTQIAHCKVVK